ncbi:MAG: hypothetical protein HY295_04675 [Thaumarchaeota archaeon]|nr:hypothetical protein [Nitrososphaerota archaeon]
MSQELPLIKQGTFYFIRNGGQDIILEDKTKRGLTVQERAVDEQYQVEAEKGMIYDMDGIGHKVGIRWYFPKTSYTFEKVLGFAEEMEKRYIKIREETCPD